LLHFPIVVAAVAAVAVENARVLMIIHLIVSRTLPVKGYNESPNLSGAFQQKKKEGKHWIEKCRNSEEPRWLLLERHTMR
tara:strand:- start:1030 stop:1269 length:240 start_codon:yes stop_codon:yes gene_type:complete